MIVTFQKTYLQELYEKGQCSDKQHRFQPQIAKKYAKVINIMIREQHIMRLAQYGSLHYEHLHGDKEGLSSVRVNDQYRIEFSESSTEDATIANICNIEELTNHYK